MLKIQAATQAQVRVLVSQMEPTTLSSIQKYTDKDPKSCLEELATMMSQFKIKTKYFQETTIWDMVQTAPIPKEQKDLLLGILAGILHDHKQAARDHHQAHNQDPTPDPSTFNWQNQPMEDHNPINHWVGNMHHTIEEMAHVLILYKALNLFPTEGEQSESLGYALLASALSDSKKIPGLMGIFAHHIEASKWTKEALKPVIEAAGLDTSIVDALILKHQFSPPFIMELMAEILMHGSYQNAIKQAFEQCGEVDIKPDGFMDLLNQNQAALKDLSEQDDNLEALVKKIPGFNAKWLENQELKQLLMDYYSKESRAAQQHLLKEVIAKGHTQDVGSTPGQPGYDHIAITPRELKILTRIHKGFTGWYRPKKEDMKGLLVCMADALQYPGSGLAKVLLCRGPFRKLQDPLLQDGIDSVLANRPRTSVGESMPLFALVPGGQDLFDDLAVISQDICDDVKGELRRALAEDSHFQALCEAVPMQYRPETKGGFLENVVFLDVPLPHTMGANKLPKYTEEDGENKPIFLAADYVKQVFITLYRKAHNKAMADGTYFSDHTSRRSSSAYSARSSESRTSQLSERVSECWGYTPNLPNDERRTLLKVSSMVQLPLREQEEEHVSGAKAPRGSLRVTSAERRPSIFDFDITVDV